MTGAEALELAERARAGQVPTVADAAAALRALAAASAALARAVDDWRALKAASGLEELTPEVTCPSCGLSCSDIDEAEDHPRHGAGPSLRLVSVGS